MFILFIFLLIDNSRSLEWNCTKNNLSNDHVYEQCTITIEYLSSQQQKHVCITNTLSINNLPSLSFSSNYSMQTFQINSCQLLTLSQLPFSLPSSLEKLDLSYNLLSTFTLSFPLPSYLKYLHLDHNPNLIEINFGSHRVQQQLIGLSLRHNKHLQLSSLPLRLTYLDLTDCNLLQSPILSLLKSLTNLTHLSLVDNQLKRLPVLDDRIQLEYLNLSNNQLTSIEDRWLHKHLRNLDLKFNQIKSLDFFKERLKMNHVSTKFISN
jgi:Leucine-rich repeat (LRR) protein